MKHEKLVKLHHFHPFKQGLFKVPGKHVEKFHVNGLNKNFTQWQRFSPHGFQEVFHFQTRNFLGRWTEVGIFWAILSNHTGPQPNTKLFVTHWFYLEFVCWMFFCVFCEFWALSEWYIVKFHTLFSWLMGVTTQAAVSQKIIFVTDWIDQNKYPL